MNGPGINKVLAGIAVTFILLTPRVHAEGPEYVSHKYCRTCHSSSEDNRYHSWLQSNHSRAFEALQGAEKANPECLRCHTTGHAGPVSDRITRKDLRGVQCEACHGPGSLYKKMSVMKDPKQARENGLWDVKREVCLKCHR
jgi:hypothetical protein